MERLGIIGPDQALLGITGQAVSSKGTDIYLDTDAHTGHWKTIVILDATTQITAITDNGGSASTIPLDAALPLGTFISANGVFTSITLGVAGGVAMGRAI